jgi:hypothetical protein
MAGLAAQAEFLFQQAPKNITLRKPLKMVWQAAAVLFIFILKYFKWSVLL